MKKISVIVFALFVLLSCKDNSKLSINGTFTNPGNERKVYLYTFQNDKMTLSDSTVISDKGAFKFTRVAPEPDIYKIAIGHNEYILIAKNGDNIDFKADLNNENYQYSLSGSADADKLEKFNRLMHEFNLKGEAVKKEFDEKVSQTPEKRDSLISVYSPLYQGVFKKSNADMIKFALENTNSLVSFYAMSMVNPEENEAAFFDYADKVDAKLKKHPALAKFLEGIKKLKKVNVGAQAPDFTINGIDGNPVKLTDFRGKYLLIDFWASWCGPCRAENPNVVKAYQQYKDKNFTILGISLDKDKDAWLKAIKDDGLTWTHASELADFNGATVELYQVQAIPASFLLDPDGKIIARNLRGEELDAFLKKTLR